MNKPLFVNNANRLQEPGSMILLVKRIGDTLERHYPGWGWCIEPFAAAGIINISSIRISTKMAYTLHTKNVQDDPQLKAAIVAGGEYLERFKIPRGGFTAERLARARACLGQYVADMTDKSMQAQKAQGNAFARTHLQRQQASGGRIIL
jgi:hypothetical protein